MLHESNPRDQKKRAQKVQLQAEIPKQKGSTTVARFAEVLHLRSAKHLSADAKDVAAGAGHFAAK